MVESFSINSPHLNLPTSGLTSSNSCPLTFLTYISYWIWDHLDSGSTWSKKFRWCRLEGYTVCRIQSDTNVLNLKFRHCLTCRSRRVRWPLQIVPFFHFCHFCNPSFPTTEILKELTIRHPWRWRWSGPSGLADIVMRYEKKNWNKSKTWWPCGVWTAEEAIQMYYGTTNASFQEYICKLDYVYLSSDQQYPVTSSYDAVTADSRVCR